MKQHHIIYSMLVCLLSFISTNQANAQLKAMPDNYYIAKGASKTLFVTNNDDFGDCAENSEELTVRITQQPLHGRASAKLQRITYRANPDYTGQDALKYEVTCNGVTSETTVYINIGDKPDFIVEKDCTVEPEAFKWRMQKAAMSSVIIESDMTTPVAGDVDEDGEIDIIVAGKDRNSIIVFNSNLEQKYVINTPLLLSEYSNMPLSLARVKISGVYKTLIICCVGGTNQNEKRLIAYSFNQSLSSFELEWTSDVLWGQIIANNPIYSVVAVSIADIDGDGNSEILFDDHVLAAESGKSIVQLPNGGRGNGPFMSYSIVACWGDIDGDGIMEAVCGNTTYKIIINDRNDPSKNTATILASSGLEDGLTSLADIDGDGILDVVVSKHLKASKIGNIYVWQGNNSSQIGQTIATSGYGPSACFIGDINGDGNPDICFTSALRLHSYYYDKVSKTFKTNWTPLKTTDNSGSTTLTLFDFNLDGKQELVYRDETTIRIIDGVTGKPIPDATFPCESVTAQEGPIIADDGTGHAAIYVVGRPEGRPKGDDYIMKFAGTSSATAKDNNWAPARKVWNQFMYNPTLVNEDLTIPRYPISRTTEVFQRDGSTWYPFNNVLQQIGPVDTYIKPYVDAPDLAFNATSSQKLLYNQAANRLDVTTTIVNYGDGDFTKDLKVDLYLYNKTTTQYRLVGTHTTPAASVTLPARGSQIVSFSVANFSSISMNADERWTLVINGVNKAPNAPTYYFSGAECRDWNNLTQRVSFVEGDKILCEDDEIQLELSPANIYDYYWYLADGITPYNGKDADNKGDSKWVKKSANEEDSYFILVVPKGGSITNPISPIKDEVILSLSPLELIWNGDNSSDWHDVLNWTNPNDPNREHVKNYIPRHCTNILIPRGLDVYPELEPGKTNYSVYDKAECYSIEYEHEGSSSTKELAGELSRPDLLTYNNVIAQLDAMSNRYYALALPLQDMYTGDLYKTNPNPFLDGMITYARKYAQTNPQSGSYLEGKWTGYFNTPNELPSVSNGLGIWFDDLAATGTQVQSFVFPKADAGYWTYNNVSQDPVQYYPTARANGGMGKYIFTPALDGAKQYVEVSVDNKTAGQTLLFGNPFISHLDFDLFYQANSSLIENYYKVLNGTGTYVFDTYYLSGGATSGNPLLTQYIAPWQSVILTIKAGAGTVNKLKIPVQASVNHVDKEKLDGLLRSSKTDNYMTIAIADDEVRARTLFAFEEGGTTSFNPKFDVLKTFFEANSTSPAGTSIYSMSDKKHLIDRKGIGAMQDFQLPIGFRSKFKGTMALFFENTHDFLPEFEELYILDKISGHKEPIIRSYWPMMYRFENTDTRAEINDRFVLVGNKERSGIEENSHATTSILIVLNKDLLSVESTNNEVLEEVTVYDLSGRIVYSDTQIMQTSFQRLLTDRQAVYLVKVRTQTAIETQKVLNQLF